MKKALLIFFFGFTMFYGQKKKNIKQQESWSITCYLPTGEKCSLEQSKGKSIKDFSSHFEEKSRTWDAYNKNENVVVVFKSFTNLPLFLLMLDKKKYSTEKIKEIIDSIEKESFEYSYYFGKNNYGHHWGLKSEIESYIKENILDREFVLETLGNPDDIKETLYGGNKVTCFFYNEEGIRIYFDDNKAIGYDEID